MPSSPESETFDLQVRSLLNKLTMERFESRVPGHPARVREGDGAERGRETWREWLWMSAGERMLRRRVWQVNETVARRICRLARESERGRKESKRVAVRR